MLCSGERKRTEVGGDPDGWAPHGSERMREVGWAEVAGGPSGLGCEEKKERQGSWAKGDGGKKRVGPAS